MMTAVCARCKAELETLDRFVDSQLSRDKSEKLLEMARSVPVSDAEREKQRRSFAFGNTKIENDRITRETIDRAAEKLEQLARDKSERRIDGQTVPPEDSIENRRYFNPVGEELRELRERVTKLEAGLHAIVDWVKRADWPNHPCSNIALAALKEKP